MSYYSSQRLDREWKIQLESKTRLSVGGNSSGPTTTQSPRLPLTHITKQQKKPTAGYDNALNLQLVSVDDDNDLHHLTLQSPTTF